MGDPKRQRKKYDTPLHPWRKERIDSERVLLRQYGLKNKKELWKMESKLRGYFRQAKKIISKDTHQSKIEREALIKKLDKYNLIAPGAKPGEVLSISLNNLLDRRLQTQVYRQGLARSISQARQFVVHGHIFVGDKKISVPSYLISRDEENKIRFDALSGLSSLEHPERAIKKVAKEEKKQEAKQKEEAKEGTREQKPRHKKSITKKRKETKK